ASSETGHHFQRNSTKPSLGSSTRRSGAASCTRLVRKVVGKSGHRHPIEAWSTAPAASSTGIPFRTPWTTLFVGMKRGFQAILHSRKRSSENSITCVSRQAPRRRRRPSSFRGDEFQAVGDAIFKAAEAVSRRPPRSRTLRQPCVKRFACKARHDSSRVRAALAPSEGPSPRGGACL